MQKQQADELITEYYKKLFGFALSKVADIDRAGELAGRITLEVYTTLLRRENIVNPEGYIWRIAQNVWVRFLDEERRAAHLPIEGLPLGDEPDADDSENEWIEKSEEYGKLRREIAYLSEVQRRIVVLHYYDKMKLADIAARLELPEGTVKWHLHEAKNSLRKGMDKMRSIGKLGITPIEFCSMGHDGRPGKRGDTADFLANRMTQNIVYAAYREPKTVNEIAEELGISPVFVADEVAVLEEYGFMDKLPADKYRTNIYITYPTKETDEARHKVLCRYAEIICEKYIPELIERVRDYDRSLIYVPDGDCNLLFWSLVPYAIGKKLRFNKNAEKYSVKRPDGGDYIAFATVSTRYKNDFNEEKYYVCGDMTRGSEKYPVSSWQLDTYYDRRSDGWRNNLYTDYEYVYEFITGALKKERSQIEKYRRLCDKGYIVDTDGQDEVNLIVVKKDEGEAHLKALLPAPSDEICALAEKLDSEIYEICRVLYPAHMQQMCRAMNTDCMAGNGMRMRVIEKMLENGQLALPSKKRANGITTLMFSDILP